MPVLYRTVFADPFLSGAANTRPLSDEAPSLAPIDASGSIHLPSRFNSRASTQPETSPQEDTSIPPVPRQPSRHSDRGYRLPGDLSPTRLSTIPSPGLLEQPDPTRSSAISSSQLLPPPRNAVAQQHHFRSSLEDPSARVPFDSIEPSPSPERNPSGHNSTASSIYPEDDAGAGHGGTPGYYGPSASYTVAPADFQPPPSQRYDAERPLSTGYVMQHRASESVHGPADVYARYEGNTAEVLDAGERRPSVSPRR